jgi:hypothetical protein
MTRIRPIVVVGFSLLLWSCATPSPSPSSRLMNAESELNACKDRLGLAATPTPDTESLYRPSSPAALTSNDVGQIRIKSMCGPELDAFLRARREAQGANR